MGSLAHLGVLGTSALAGSKERSPWINPLPLRVGRGDQQSSSPQSRCHFQCLPSVIMLASCSPLFFLSFFFFPVFPAGDNVDGGRALWRSWEGWRRRVLLRRLGPREDAAQIGGAAAIQSRSWAADVEARAGGSAEGAWKGANPIDPGTQAASETPGQTSEATVPRMTESRRLPHA